MATETEGTFKIGNTSLHTKTWMVSRPHQGRYGYQKAHVHPQPQGPTKAKLIFVHGYSDHMGRYYGLFPHLASLGIAVYGLDQRGWGKSVLKPADKGLTGPTSQVLSDLAAFIKDKLPSDVPVFVMGHSMGGGEVLTLASDPAYEDLVGQIRGWVLESPFIAFTPSEQPGAIKTFVGKLIGRLLPHQHLYSPMPAEYLSRDPAVVQSVKEDPLCHDTGTLEGLAGLLERTDNLCHGRVTLSTKVKSLFLAHGTADRTTSFDASKKWYDVQKIEDARHKAYEGCFHQLHSDLCKEEFYKDVGDWILERCGAGPGVAKL
jgi:acylglycerol lipase